MRAWSCPSELNQPLPRDFRLSTASKLLTSLTTGSVLGLALFIIAFAFQASHRMDDLRERGASTAAVVTRLYAEPDRHGGNPTYFVEYKFSLVGPQASNAPHVGNSTVFLPDFQRIQVGQALEVSYDPEALDKSALKISLNSVWVHPYHNAIMLTGAVGALFGGVLAFMAVYIGRIYRKERKLVMWGRAARAAIVDTRETFQGLTRRIQVTYQFKDETGSTVEGVRDDLPTAGQMRNTAFSLYSLRITANPTVLYDPLNSSTNMLYPPNMIFCCLAPRNS